MLKITIILYVLVLSGLMQSCGAEDAAQDTVSQTAANAGPTYRNGTAAGAITSAASDAVGR